MIPWLLNIKEVTPRCSNKNACSVSIDTIQRFSMQIQTHDISSSLLLLLVFIFSIHHHGPVIVYLPTWHHPVHQHHIFLHLTSQYGHITGSLVIYFQVTLARWKITSLNHKRRQIALTHYGHKRMGHAGKKWLLVFIECWWVMKLAAQDVTVIFVKAARSYSWGLAVSMVMLKDLSSIAIFTTCASAGARGLIRF